MRTTNDLLSQLKELGKALRFELPQRIAENMVKETQRNFRAQGYTNDGKFERWKDRRYDVLKTPAGIKLGYKKLLRTRRLYNSYRPYIKRFGGFNIRVGVQSDVPYAKVQNEGGRTKGRWIQEKYKIDRPAPRIPARKHAGIGTKTMIEVEKEINRTIKKYLK